MVLSMARIVSAPRNISLRLLDGSRFSLEIEPTRLASLDCQCYHLNILLLGHTVIPVRCRIADRLPI